MANSDEKNFPQSSEGVRGLLNMDGTPPETSAINQPAGKPPENLPFMEHIEEPVTTPQTQPKAAIPDELPTILGAPAPVGHTGPIDQLTVPSKLKGNELFGFVIWMVKAIAPYVVIFAIGLGLYFFYFSDFSVNSLFNNDKLKIESVNVDNKELDELKKQEQAAYDKWMSQFFFDVNDESIIAMDTDVSGNGLTNFEKYLLDLNPKVYSTRGTESDGQLVLKDINPWTGRPFSDEQKELIKKYINKELINNRIAAAALTRGVTKFAQYVNEDSPYYIDPVTLREIQRDNPIIVTPAEPASPGYIPEYSPPQTANGSTGNGGSASAPVNTVFNGTQIDVSVPGRLEIPANKISVPVIWTQNVSSFDQDLKRGIVHYPGTAMPGDIGTSYISGHSSGYLWDKSPYKQIFAVLGQVKDGTSFSITAQQKNGKTVTYHYVIERRGEFDATDQAQFISTGDSIVALSTCWPVGTTDRRLVLFGKLSQTVQN